MNQARAPRLYGHGKLVAGRWIRDDDKPPSPINMLRRDLDELRDIEERLKSWVRWYIKQKMAGKKGRLRKTR